MSLSRRSLLKTATAGTALAALGAASSGVVRSAPASSHGFAVPAGKRKPVFTPPAGAMSPVAHSVSDTLFWSDIMAEHALFFAMLLPGQEDAPMRMQALAFHHAFQEHFEHVSRASIDESNYRDVNRHTTELLLPIIEFKHTLEELQGTGAMHSLVWRSLAAHTRAEAERFTARLQSYSRGVVEFDRGELAQFWTRIMGEHALFVAGLLDPVEDVLIDQARTTGRTFLAMRDAGVADLGTLLTSADEIIAFKETAEAGIESGQIQSIIHPTLADHVRREAVKFRDELQRASV